MAKKKRFERVGIKDKNWHQAKWEVCLKGPSEFTDCLTLCGKTGWSTDHILRDVPQDTPVTCRCCLGIVAFMHARSL